MPELLFFKHKKEKFFHMDGIDMISFIKEKYKRFELLPTEILVNSDTRFCIAINVLSLAFNDNGILLTEEKIIDQNQHKIILTMILMIIK